MPKVLTPLIRHRRPVDRLLLFAGPASAACIVLGGLLLYRHHWPQQRFLFFYVAPLFAYGAAWARDRLARLAGGIRPTIVVDAVAFVAGAIRIAGGWGVLPYSGHMLFLTYAALSPGTRPLRWLAVLLIGVTTTFKLLLWHDLSSWGLGLVAGVLLAGVRTFVAHRTVMNERVLAPPHG